MTMQFVNPTEEQKETMQNFRDKDEDDIFSEETINRHLDAHNKASKHPIIFFTTRESEDFFKKFFNI